MNWNLSDYKKGSSPPLVSLQTGYEEAIILFRIQVAAYLFVAGRIDIGWNEVYRSRCLNRSFSLLALVRVTLHQPEPSYG